MSVRTQGVEEPALKAPKLGSVNLGRFLSKAELQGLAVEELVRLDRLVKGLPRKPDPRFLWPDSALHEFSRELVQ